MVNLAGRNIEEILIWQKMQLAKLVMLFLLVVAE